MVEPVDVWSVEPVSDLLVPNVNLESPRRRASFNPELRSCRGLTAFVELERVTSESFRFPNAD